ncbi:hypothetical protein BH11VER1_BH11VER1_26040 [soil metagenome]
MPRIKVTEPGVREGRFFLFINLVIALAWGIFACPVQAAADVIEAITFETDKGQLYVPMEDAARELQLKIERSSKTVFVGPQKVRLVAASLRRLLDGTELVSLADLQKAGAELGTAQTGGPLIVLHGRSTFEVVKAVKRVEVDLTKQQLSAWEGNRLVLQTHISSGRYRNSTPVGEFSAGPYKAEMHFSQKYNNAPMPWSVQLNDHVFIHGFSSVPHYPASHGCIRMPLDKGNPAKFFYEWVDVGTAVKVMRS